MPHTHKKHRVQERKRHPKHYEKHVERISPKTVADCILLTIQDNALTIEQFKQIYKEVIRRYNAKQNNA